MTMTPGELADLASTLATASKTLAEADKARADADKARGEADKARGDADKTRADADKVRADTAQDQRLAQNKADVAAADLDTKKIANDKARAEADAARLDKLIQQVTGAVPDISSLSKNTVTFGDGRALRQSEAISLAVKKVATAVAAGVAKALPALEGSGRHRVFVTAETQLVAAVAGYWQLSDEATRLTTALADTHDTALTALEAANAAEPPERGFDTRSLGAGEVGLAGAALAGKVVTEVASLFETEIAATTNTGDVASLSVQAAVLHELLGSTIAIHHQWVRVPDATSPLRAAVGTLITKDIEAAQTDALLLQAIAALGDPAAALAKATKEAENDKLPEPERRDAEVRAEKARQQVALLADLQEHRTRLGAVLLKVRAFTERVTTVSATTGDSPLTAAYAIEPLTSDGADSWVLVLGPAKTETYQMVISRRILAPRLHVSTGVEVDYVLVKGAEVHAAGHETASAAYWGKVKASGAEWKTTPALTS